jgi:hypothetical protein
MPIVQRFRRRSRPTYCSGASWIGRLYVYAVTFSKVIAAAERA